MADHLALSADYADVMDAYDLASDGDRVLVPAGSAVWTVRFTLSKAITLQGAGSTGGTTTTIHFGPMVDPAGADSNGILINPTTGVATVRDFIFEDDANGPQFRLILATGAGEVARITSCKFPSRIASGASGQMIGFGTINDDHNMGPYGIVDNCDFTGITRGAFQLNCIFVMHNGGSTINSWNWSQAHTWGTRDAVFIEDCAFSVATTPGGACVDGYAGCRVVFRHNTVENLYFATHPHNHGGAQYSASLQVEVHDNDWHVSDTTNGIPNAVWLRDGTGVFYNNTFTQAAADLYGGKIFLFSVEGASTDFASEGYGSQLAYPADYPHEQQVGQGVGGLVPIYVWDNTVVATAYGDAQGVKLGMNADADFVGADRDVYSGTAMPDYVPYVYPHPLNSGITPTPPFNLTPPVLSGITEVNKTSAFAHGTYDGSTPITFVKKLYRCTTP